MGIAEFIIGRAFARPVGSTHRRAQPIATSWWGIVGPAGMPANVVNALNSEIGKMLTTRTQHVSVK